MRTAGGDRLASTMPRQPRATRPPGPRAPASSTALRTAPDCDLPRRDPAPIRRTGRIAPYTGPGRATDQDGPAQAAGCGAQVRRAEGLSGRPGTGAASSRVATPGHRVPAQSGPGRLVPDRGQGLIQAWRPAEPAPALPA